MNRLIRLFVVSLTWFACVAAQAQTGSAPRRLTILSEVARQVAVVTYQETVGSNLDQNIQQRMDIPGGAMDRAALALAKAQVLQREPQAVVTTFVPLDTDVFYARQPFREGSDSGLPADLKDALRQQGSTQLLLLTRYSAEAAIQLVNAKTGSGRLEGVGFYIDNSTQVSDREAGNTTRGFLAPFVYLRASLIDAASGRVLRTRTYTRATAVPSTQGGESAHPWFAMDDRRKVKMLSDMLDEALTAVVPPLLAP